MKMKFRHIVRAVIVQNGHILIARMKGAHSFFPSGGVELGESCELVLKRELREELGIKECEIDRFLGALEISFTEPDGSMLHEVSHWFQVNSAELKMNQIPKSLEPHLEFYWIENTVEKLRFHNVLPEPIQEVIPKTLQENRTFWISKM